MPDTQHDKFVAAQPVVDVVSNPVKLEISCFLQPRVLDLLANPWLKQQELKSCFEVFTDCSGHCEPVFAPPSVGVLNFSGCPGRDAQAKGHSFAM